MTENTKNMMQNLYKILFDKNKEARRDFFHLIFDLLILIFGVISGSFIVNSNSHMALPIAFILNSLFISWLCLVRFKERAGV